MEERLRCFFHPYPYMNKIYGPVIEVEAPKLGGVRFNSDGTEMMGFLEPKWFKQ